MNDIDPKDDTENSWFCILKNELQLEKIEAPVLSVNSVKGQMPKAQQFLILSTVLNLSSPISNKEKKNSVLTAFRINRISNMDYRLIDD